MSSLAKPFFKPISIYPLVTFRVLYGLMMAYSVLRFWLNGWIEELYIRPDFHFKFYGFGWVQEPPAILLYMLFLLIGISSVGIAAGFLFRWCSVIFFVAFTYVELIDATYYLNHYYFVSIIGLFLIFTEANGNVSLDVFFKLKKPVLTVESWNIWGMFLLLGIVYFYAGLAKLNYDWIVNALPLKIWLAPHTNLPIVGAIMDKEYTAYVFSWGGALFDLSIPFLLLYKRTRIAGYFLVIVFHVFTSILFPIGVFPFVMIASTTIFLSENLHKKLWFRYTQTSSDIVFYKKNRKLKTTFLLVFFGFQLLFPFRYLLYDGNLFWTEQGYRFSWRVMLMEKAGYAQFKVYPNSDYKQFIVVNTRDFLTPQQEKMMSTQPDFILQYAHFLANHYQKRRSYKPKVTADVFVSLNGQGSRRFVQSDVNLTNKTISLKPMDWLEEY